MVTVSMSPARGDRLGVVGVLDQIGPLVGGQGGGTADGVGEAGLRTGVGGCS